MPIVLYSAHLGVNPPSFLRFELFEDDLVLRRWRRGNTVRFVAASHSQGDLMAAGKVGLNLLLVCRAVTSSSHLTLPIASPRIGMALTELSSRMVNDGPSRARFASVTGSFHGIASTHSCQNATASFMSDTMSSRNSKFTARLFHPAAPAFPVRTRACRATTEEQ